MAKIKKSHYDIKYDFSLGAKLDSEFLPEAGKSLSESTCQKPSCERYDDEEPCGDLMLDNVPSIKNVFNLSTAKSAMKDRPLMVGTASTLPALLEDVDLMRREICFERVGEKIYVNMVAIDKKCDSNNSIQSIKSNGDPLGGYAYTTETDIYLIGCYDYCPIGIIPMAFRISVPGYAGKQLVPLPDSLIFKYAAPQQRKLIRIFKEKNPECDIQFVQSLSRS